MYRMHEELCRREVPPVKQLAGVKKPYTKEQKATIVARGEARIGHHHFIGGK
jgi:hypothetical protein